MAKKNQIKDKQPNGNLQYVRADFVPSTLDDSNLTVDVTFATASPVLRYSWTYDEYYHEVLDMNGANLERVTERGLPVLDNHARWGSVSQVVIGRSHNIRREGDVWVGTIKFSRRKGIEDLVNDIRDGIITDISFGYSIDKVERQERKEDERYRTYIVRMWTPNEISLVAVPADARAGVRSGDIFEHFDGLRDDDPQTTVSQTTEDKSIMKREQIIALLKQRGITVADDASDEWLTGQLRSLIEGQTQAPAATPAAGKTVEDANAAEAAARAAAKAERERSTAIIEAVRKAGLPAEYANELVASEMSVDQARAAIIERFVADDPNKNSRNATGARVGAEAGDKLRGAMENALYLRANPEAERTMQAEVVASVREYRGLTMLEMMRELLDARGVNTRGMSKRELFNASVGRGYQTTSDFPIITGNIINRTLRAAYDLAAPTWHPFCRRNDQPDFKETTSVQLSGLIGGIDEIKEHQEYKRGKMTEAKEKWAVKKYGKIIGLSYEAIVNDDLGAFNKIPVAMAEEIRQNQSDIIYALIVNNVVMGDNNPLFDAAHNNLASGSDPINRASLAAARASFRNQTSLNGRKLNLMPKYLLVGPDQEEWARQYTSSDYNPTEPGKINTMKGLLDVIVEARITGDAWYLFASPDRIDTIEYGFLRDEGELYLEQRNGFDIDGIEWKVRSTFGAKPIDWRGMYKNAGAQPQP